MLQKKFALARTEIELLLSSGDVRSLTSQASTLKADLARCLADSKSIDSSVQLIGEVLSLDLSEYESGDRVLIYASVRESYRSLGLLDKLADMDQPLAAALADHRSQTLAIEKLLVPFQSLSILN